MGKMHKDDWSFYPHLDRAVVEFMEDYLNPDMEVLEFGSGTSTIWLAQRVKRLVTLESHQEWRDRVLGWLGQERLNNVTMLWYRDILPEDTEYDMALIDDDLPLGWYEWEFPRRLISVMRASRVMKPNGAIIVDDVYDTHSKEAAIWLINHGWKQMNSAKDRQHTTYFKKSEDENGRQRR